MLLVNYKLKLPKGMQIHPVFYVLRLEPAHLDAKLMTKADRKMQNLDKEYKVKRILEAKNF